MASATITLSPNSVVFSSDQGTSTFTINNQNVIVSVQGPYIIARTALTHHYPGGTLIGTYDYSETALTLTINSNGSITSIVGFIEWEQAFDPDNDTISFNTHSIKLQKEGNFTKVYMVENLGGSL